MIIEVGKHQFNLEKIQRITYQTSSQGILEAKIVFDNNEQMLLEAPWAAKLRLLLRKMIPSEFL